MNARGTISLAVLTTLAACGDDSCVTGVLSTDGLPELQQLIVKSEAPWMKNAKSCQVGGYLVMAPADGAAPGEIVVTRNGTTVIIDERNTIYIQAKDKSLVSVQDRDAIGRFDWVSYDAIDPADGQKYSFTDVNGDGRLDTKIGEHGGWVNLNGDWSKFEKHGEQLGAVVDGEWRPLEKQGRLWRVKSP
jgi:hypothetical protein